LLLDHRKLLGRPELPDRPGSGVVGLRLTLPQPLPATGKGARSLRISRREQDAPLSASGPPSPKRGGGGGTPREAWGGGRRGHRRRRRWSGGVRLGEGSAAPTTAFS